MAEALETQHQLNAHHSQQSSPVATLPPSPIIEATTRPKSESRVEVARIREEYQEYVDDVLEWVAAQENLDVYQLNAFYSATHEINYYWRIYWKTLCVQFIQTAGLAILLYHDWLEGTVLAEIGIETELKGFCDTRGSLDLKLLSFFLLSFLSSRLSDQIATMADYGMYSWGADIKSPHFVNWGWIAYGLITNYITLVSSFLISGLVVYNALTPLDMILDFVALYFIIDLDDEMVAFHDYNDMETWFKGNDSEDIESGSDESPFESWLYGVAVGDEQYDDTTTTGKCGSCCDKCGMRCMSTMTRCRDPKIARTLMLPLSIIMPAYVLICY